MTYTDLTASTLVSGVPDILNGVKTRAVEFHMRAGVTSTAGQGTACGLHGREFLIGEDVTLITAIPERADILVAPTLRLLIAPCTSEVGREVRFQLDVDVVHASANPIAGTGALSYASADINIGATLGTMQIVDTTLSTAVWDSVTEGFIAGTLSRIALVDGTNLTGDCAVLASSLVYTIER